MTCRLLCRKRWQCALSKGAVLNGSGRVVRGGSWINNPRNCRTTYRNRNDPDERNDNTGFRLVSLSCCLALPARSWSLILGIPAFTDAGSSVRGSPGAVPELSGLYPGSRIYVTGPCGAGRQRRQIRNPNTETRDRHSAAFGRSQRMYSHKGTKITKKSGVEMVSHLCGFVALCENQVFVFQGLVFLYIQNLRKNTRSEQVVVRRTTIQNGLRPGAGVSILGA